MSVYNELYQELILDHNRRPRNRRKLESPDYQAEGYNPLCGDRVTVYLKIGADGVVQDAAFEGSGCAISTASASLMTEAVKGKTLDQARALFAKFHELVTGDPERSPTFDELGKLAAFSGVCQYPARVKCATLAWHTFSAAIDKSAEVVSTE